MEHILYAIAAGIAMFIATAIAFMGQSWFGNLSTSLFILLVVSYMLKDRIKDIFRDLFSKSIGSFFYDRRVKVYDSRVKRIYHLNLIVWYQGDDAAFIDRIRLIVDGKGIKRIEKVDSFTSS